MERKVKEVRSLEHFGCWTDRYIIVAGEIYLLSLFGSPTRVNAIKAVITKGDPVYLQDCWTGKRRIKAQRPSRAVKSWTRQLAAGVTHSLLYAPDYLAPAGNYPRKIFYGDSREQVMEKFFYAAQRRYSTPLLPEWSGWLWENMEQVVPADIKSWGCNQVLGCKFLEEANLEARLFEAGSPLSADLAANG
jgi:hypothetical protein